MNGTLSEPRPKDWSGMYRLLPGGIFDVPYYDGSGAPLFKRWTFPTDADAIRFAADCGLPL